MKRTSSLVRGGFTLIELLVVIAIIALLASLSIPAVGGAITKAQLAQAVSNARQIHIATTGAAADASASGSSTSGWPADILPPVSGVTGFIYAMRDDGYLKEGDWKVYGAGKNVYQGKTQNTIDPTNEVGFNIFKVSDADEGNRIFLTTKNVTINGTGASQTTTMDANEARVFATKGFVVFRKGGDGTYYLKDRKAGDGTIGELPGDGQPLTE